MKFYASWGKQDCQQAGRNARKETFKIIEFESNSLTSAKARATREDFREIGC